VRAPAWATYEAACDSAWATYEAVRDSARATYEAVRAPAWATLLDAVQSDPLAAWIVEHAMPDHHDEALTVLRALPATLVQLDDLADRHGWCDSWADQVTAARVAGVIPAVTA